VEGKEIPNVVLATNEKAQGGLVSRGRRPWGKGRGKERYIPDLFPMCSHQVLKIFPLGSPNISQVPKMFPKMFPMSPHF